VEDQGPGIPAEDQSRMYGKFSRLTPKPTAGEPSTGLGLWIVKELTESMHGSIRCNSTVGQGTTFIVEWPLATNAPDRPHGSSTTAASAAKNS
jgi:signal transduction histidine kinase